MKATRTRANSETGGCLLSHANFVSESEPSSYEGREPAWKAGTLPTELLPLSNYSRSLAPTEVSVKVNASAQPTYSSA